MNIIKKEKLTIEQLAELSYYFAKKFGLEYVKHELSKENTPFKQVDKNIFAHERLIMIFWILDRMVSDKDRKLMSAIHKMYFEDIGILNKPDEMKKEISFIMDRYKEYYDAWDDNASSEQWILGGAIGKNIFQKDKILLNADISFLIIMDVLQLMKQIKESIIDKYEISN